MGAALYVSFQGQDTFSTAYEALQIVTKPSRGAGRSHRSRATASARSPQTRSELEIVEASIRETVDGRDIIRKQPFVRIRATLATAATALSDDVPDYDPVAILEATQPIVADADDVANHRHLRRRSRGRSCDQAGRHAADAGAAARHLRPDRRRVRAPDASRTSSAKAATPARSRSPMPRPTAGVRDLGIVDRAVADRRRRERHGDAQDHAGRRGRARPHRAHPHRQGDRPARRPAAQERLHRRAMIDAIAATLQQRAAARPTLPSGARLRILFGASRTSDTLIPYRISIYVHDDATGADKHAATVALTDRGTYVLGLAPAEIAFPEEDTEAVNVANLPSIYRSIWETARKHDIDDATTERIVAHVRLRRRPDQEDRARRLDRDPADPARRRRPAGAALCRRSSSAPRCASSIRFRTDDGTVDFYDPAGETGKRFLTRRPLQGGGRLASRFGMPHPPDLQDAAACIPASTSPRPRGTPIYASGDGVIEKAQWVSGYGRYVEIKHVNGYETGYGHMSRIADGIKPGVKVRQGQVIGYVGSTGNSTGNHLHFEIKVNGRFVDPLSVKLPRDKSLAAQVRAAPSSRPSRRSAT